MDHEVAITKYLSQKLGLLEKGLTLLGREYSIPDTEVSGGRLDILARDSFGHFIIIEVKRNEQAARQAIDELFKYVRLLHTTHRIPRHKIRCFIVSTTWHQLRGPFSELKRYEDFDVTGFQIDAKPDGTVLSATLVAPLPDRLDLTLKPVLFFLFKSWEREMRFIHSVIQQLEAFNFADFVLLKLDNKLHNSYLHGVLLAASDEDALKDIIHATIRNGHPAKSDPNPWSFHEIISDEVITAQGQHFDYVESVTYSTIASVLNDWTIVELVPIGCRVEERLIYNDKDLLNLITGVGGKNRFNYQSICSPKHRLSWNNNKQELINFLGEKHPWLDPILHYLKELEAERPEASVLFSLFDSQNLFNCLHPQLRGHEPHVFIVVEDSSEITIVKGFLEWNGTRVEAITETIYSSLLKICGAHAENSNDWKDHHLSAVLIERTLPSGADNRLVLVHGNLMRSDLTSQILTLDDFILENQTYIESIVRLCPEVIKLG